jgi:hypothetical protein
MGLKGSIIGCVLIELEEFEFPSNLRKASPNLPAMMFFVPESDIEGMLLR